MRHRKKMILYLVVTQACCLAVGLWIHDQFLTAVATHAVAMNPDAESPGQGGTVIVATLPVATQVVVQMLSFLWVGGLQGITAWLLLTRMQGEQERLQNQSQEESLIRARELVRTRDAVIFGLAKLAESRDPDTGHHLERIALYSTRLAAALRRHPKYRRMVSTSFVRSIGISSALHDIGKVGVKDAILLKPGPLTPQERKEIELHAIHSGDCIRQIQRRIGDPSFLEMAYDIAMYHHEKWDGSGYPHQLAGEAIPLAARIVAIADVYDALSVRRVYKDPYPHAVCVEKICRDAGKHFDPDLVEVFLSLESQFREIKDRFAVVENAARAVVVRGDNGRRHDSDELRMTPEQEALLKSTIGPIGFPTSWMTNGPSATSRKPAVAATEGRSAGERATQLIVVEAEKN